MPKPDYVIIYLFSKRGKGEGGGRGGEGTKRRLSTVNAWSLAILVMRLPYLVSKGEVRTLGLGSSNTTALMYKLKNKNISIKTKQKNYKKSTKKKIMATNVR